MRNYDWRIGMTGSEDLLFQKMLPAVFFLVAILPVSLDLAGHAPMLSEANARQRRSGEEDSEYNKDSDIIGISSVEELARHAGRDAQNIRMRPGLYHLSDYITPEKLREMRETRDWHFIDFSGNENMFDLTGVEIEVDTQLRQELRAPTHNPEFIVSGNKNTLKGLTMTNTGDGTSAAGNVLSVSGAENTLQDITLHVRGSYPYGYGDLFGKGGGPIIRHRKHSGIQITGDNARIIGCKIFMRSYGHGFYVQGGENAYFEDCYVEGEMRSTDDMLAETHGPAYDVDFRSVYRNRDGEFRVLPSYMKSLAEDGFRSYGVDGTTFINCTARNMRGGFELRSEGHRLENCRAFGNERAFWIGGNSKVKRSRGDAKYGPLLFLEGTGSSVELELLADESDKNVHALATIHGSGHTVSIRPWGGERRDALPIRVAFSQPGGGEGMSPYGQNEARDLILENMTSMPVVIGALARECRVRTLGEVIENEGEDIQIENLESPR